MSKRVKNSLIIILLLVVALGGGALPDFATCFILTIEKNVENTALGLYFL